MVNIFVYIKKKNPRLLHSFINSSCSVGYLGPFRNCEPKLRNLSHARSHLLSLVSKRLLFLSKAMAENSGINDNHGVVLSVENDHITRDRPTSATKPNHESGSRISIPFMKKVSPRLRVSAAFMQKVIPHLLRSSIICLHSIYNYYHRLNYVKNVGLNLLHTNCCVINTPLKHMMLTYTLLYVFFFNHYSAQPMATSSAKYKSREANFLTWKGNFLLMTVDCWAVGYIHLDICRLCIGADEFELRKCGEFGRNFNGLGAGCDDSGLHCWSRLRCPF